MFVAATNDLGRVSLVSSHRLHCYSILGHNAGQFWHGKEGLAEQDGCWPQAGLYIVDQHAAGTNHETEQCNPCSLAMSRKANLPYPCSLFSGTPRVFKGPALLTVAEAFSDARVVLSGVIMFSTFKIMCFVVAQSICVSFWAI